MAGYGSGWWTCDGEVSGSGEALGSDLISVVQLDGRGLGPYVEGSSY